MFRKSRVDPQKHGNSYDAEHGVTVFYPVDK